MLWPLAHCPPIEDFAGFWSNRKMLSRVRWIKILEEGLEEFLVQHCICEHVQNRSFSAPVSQHGQWVEISHWALTLYVQRVALSAQQIRTVGEKRRRSTGNILSLWWGRVRKSGAAFIFSFWVKMEASPLLHGVDPQWTILFPWQQPPWSPACLDAAAWLPVLQ